MALSVTDKGSFDINTICITSLQICIWKHGIDEQQKKLVNAHCASLNVKHQEDVIDPVTTTITIHYLPMISMTCNPQQYV